METSSARFERSSPHEECRTGPIAGVRTLRLDHDLRMVGAARGQLRRWLHQRGCTAVDDAALVLSELVTNAMVHARAGCTIEMVHDDDCLRLTVRDPNPAPPVIRAVGPHDIGGRGLRVVDAIATAWGWEPTLDGKAVWAELDAPVPRVARTRTPQSKPS